MGIDDDNIDSFDDQSSTDAEGVTSAGEYPTMTAAPSQLDSKRGRKLPGNYSREPHDRAVNSRSQWSSSYSDCNSYSIERTKLIN